ncbi:hypothetical protein [Klebsiella oxytoca]|uniref:hypothetical protein n=1 Tax=Klebsiella oxytoca TaxID=571 RepID=UPI001E4632FA|nr:hypothetical protein [Klebsiella oxytoca]
MFRTEDIIDEITQWIDSNLHKPLKIEDVAARAGYSKWHLQRIFVQVRKVSLGKYIRDKKLKLAAKEGANKQVISSQADSLIKISRIWADFFPANTSN